MRRDIEEDLLRWSQTKNRLALIVRGARQVGKSYIVEKFGKEHFQNSLTINFEQYPEYKRCFEKLDPKKIVNSLELLSNSSIIPGQTLLFLDEIQECPQAILALRYFKEQMPELHVVGAGSLLEFTLHHADFRMPVGRVQFLYLRPLSFFEYLRASGNEKLRDYLKKVSLQEEIESTIHDRLLGLIKEYIALGGMPAVIKRFLETKSLLQCQEIQTAILSSYRNDFGKYAPVKKHNLLQMIFEKAPGLVAQWFKYTKLDPDIQTRTLRDALLQLCHAGLISLVHATSGSGLPFVSHMNEKKFKLLFLDVGLAKRACNLDLKILMEEDLLLINRGALAEQYVGQELLAYMPPEESNQLYFWVREKKSSSAEVDYLFAHHTHVIPIEVKAGAIGSLRSLKLFIKEKNSPCGVRISELPLSYESNVLSVPFYLISQIPRLLTEIS